MNGERYDGNVK